MNWGNLNRGFKGVAIKRLSSHEVDPLTSNGHEFQGANNLTGLLGTEDFRDRPTTYHFISDDGASPRLRQVIRSTSSWYDSRRNQPHRKAEWRLYYPSSVNLIQKFCQPGDLLLLALRNDNGLSIFLAPEGSVSEQVLLQAFGVTQAHYQQSGQVRWMDTREAPSLDFVEAEAMEQLTATFEEAGEPENEELAQTVEEIPPGDQHTADIAARMIELWPDGKLGPTRDVVDLVVNTCDPNAELDPDHALEHWLEVAEASYRIWEKEAARRFIGPLRTDENVTDIQLVEEIGSRWMSFRQSRVSRAGKVMEEFLAIIFRRAGLRFAMGADAKTENGKLPDFLFPDSASYHNPDFPTSHLRILGAKTSFKDRWRQILSEGDRVPIKHGVTRDPFITASMFQQMKASGFVVIMPETIMKKYQKMERNVIPLYAFIEEIASLKC